MTAGTLLTLFVVPAVYSYLGQRGLTQNAETSGVRAYAAR
jgi:hypothetical protein